jgi:hypothetical protein
MPGKAGAGATLRKPTAPCMAARARRGGSRAAHWGTNPGRVTGCRSTAASARPTCEAVDGGRCRCRSARHEPRPGRAGARHRGTARPGAAGSEWDEECEQVSRVIQSYMLHFLLGVCQRCGEARDRGWFRMLANANVPLIIIQPILYEVLLSPCSLAPDHPRPNYGRGQGGRGTACRHRVATGRHGRQARRAAGQAQRARDGTAERRRARSEARPPGNAPGAPRPLRRPGACVAHAQQPASLHDVKRSPLGPAGALHPDVNRTEILPCTPPLYHPGTPPPPPAQIAFSEHNFWATPAPLPADASAAQFSEARARAHTKVLVEDIRDRQVGGGSEEGRGGGGRGGGRGAGGPGACKLAAPAWSGLRGVGREGGRQLNCPSWEQPGRRRANSAPTCVLPSSTSVNIGACGPWRPRSALLALWQAAST